MFPLSPRPHPANAAACRHRPRAVVLLAGLMALAPASVAAQRIGERECQAIVARAHSDPADRNNLATVGGCPNAFGPTFAALLSDPVVYADSALYDEVVARAARRREPEIFAAALAIAQDTMATRLQRLSAIEILIHYFSRAAETNLRGMPQTFARVDICALGSGSQARTGDNPLPADAQATALGVATAIGNAPGPDAVRVLAHCLIAATTSNPDYDRPAGPDMAFVPSEHFRVIVLCGGRIRLRNTSYAAVSLRVAWGIDSTAFGVEANQYDFTMPGRTISMAEATVVLPALKESDRRFTVLQVLTGSGEAPYGVLVADRALNRRRCGR